MHHKNDQLPNGDDLLALSARRTEDRFGPDGLSRKRGVPKFGFREDGCIKALAEVHRSYLAGLLSDEQCWQVDNHLLSCRRCENHWDALTCQLEDSFPRQERSAEETNSEEAETEGDFRVRKVFGAASAQDAF